MTRSASRGFTLIELLVVIAIIGILSAVVLASISTARYKAYDAQRRSDLQAMQQALELYYSKHASYPSTGGAYYAAAGVNASVHAVWIPNLVSDGDISVLPQDPQFPNYSSDPTCTVGVNWPSEFVYESGNGSGYLLLDMCPANSDVANTNSGDALYDSIRPTWAWQVCSGADCSD